MLRCSWTKREVFVVPATCGRMFAGAVATRISGPTVDAQSNRLRTRLIISRGGSCSYRTLPYETTREGPDLARAPPPVAPTALRSFSRIFMNASPEG